MVYSALFLHSNRSACQSMASISISDVVPDIIQRPFLKHLEEIIQLQENCRDHYLNHITKYILLSIVTIEVFASYFLYKNNRRIAGCHLFS